MDELITYHPNRVYIYCLIDPRDEAVFYVGQSKRPYDRLVGHIQDSTYRTDKANGKYPCSSGPRIRSIIDEGYYPNMLLLCIVHDAKEADSLESRLLERFRSIGLPVQKYNKYSKI